MTFDEVRTGIMGLSAAEQKKIIIEGNYSAQLAGVVREKTGIAMDYSVLKWNGRPISTDEVYEAVKLILQEKAPTRQVLTRGS